jgi:predicted O-methyltransferase YrrM
MSSRTISLDDPLYEYLLAHSVRDDDILRRLREETAGMTSARMQISPEQGQLMGFLINLIGARTALEVGVFTGYSSLCVARALPADGRLVACDVSEEWTSIARRYWEDAGVADRIELHLGPATETLDGLIADGAGGTFDFAFIDADKVSYVDYYERTLTLLRPGGLVGVDNVLWQGRVVEAAYDDEDTRAIRTFNELAHADERVDICMLPIGDGLTLLRKRK